MEIIRVDREVVNNDLDYLKANYPEIFKIHSHTNQWEKALIYGLCKGLPERSSIIELGAHFGATSCVMGIAANMMYGTVNCIDTWDNRNIPGEEERDTYAEWRVNTNRYDLRIKPYIGTTEYWAAHSSEIWNIRNLNCIFFDADHSYAGITEDIKAWMPLCGSGCCLIFHDYSGKDGRPEIRRAVEELIFPVQKGPGYAFESIYYTNLP